MFYQCRFNNSKQENLTKYFAATISFLDRKLEIIQDYLNTMFENINNVDEKDSLVENFIFRKE